MAVSSPAKIAANRRNAKKSTGPKTKRGKAIVRYNAMKHGLLAKEAVITVGDGKENEADFGKTLQSLVDDFQPVGPMEQILVERIAVSYWRLRRALRAETGAIRNQLDSFIWTSARKAESDLKHNMRFSDLPECRESIMTDPKGLQLLIDELEVVKTQIEEDGHISEHSIERLFEFYGRTDLNTGSLLNYYNRLADKVVNGDSGVSQVEPLNEEERKQTLLGLVKWEISSLKKTLKQAETKVKLGLQAESMALSIPDANTTNTCLRYETTIERQLYRALNQLERLQRARKGDAVPPPINVELSASA
ncbi:MAG: hypothetical protein ABII79_05885 [bacterium]